MARAPWYTAAGRWLNGVGAKSRRDPRTGVEQIRLSTGWWSSEHGSAGRKPGRPHPTPPRRPGAVAHASTPIGAGRIGVGEALGTTRGTPISFHRAAESIMPIGVGVGIRGSEVRSTKYAPGVPRKGGKFAKGGGGGG